MTATTSVVALREQMATRYKELVGLGEIERDARSDEQSGRITALIAELNDLTPKLEAEERLVSTMQQATAFTEPASGLRGAAQQAAGGTLNDPDDPRPLDRQTLATRFLNSEQALDYRKSPGGRSRPFRVGDFFDETRTLVYTGGTAASLTTPMIVPGITGPARPGLGDNAVRSVLTVGNTGQDSITFFKENSFTNASAAVAEAVSVSTGAKPESAVDIIEATIPIVTLAHWIPITRQALDDIGQLQSYINDLLLYGLVRTESGQLLNGNGTAPNMTGLLATSGVQALDATYFTANPVAGAGTGVENYNRLLRGKTKVTTTGGANATFYIINPADWETLISAVNANGVFYANGPFGLAAQERLWGLTVVISPDIAAKTALVGDGSMATVWDRQTGTLLFAEQHSDFFTRNIVVVMAEERVGLSVRRPSAFAKVTLV